MRLTGLWIHPQSKICWRIPPQKLRSWVLCSTRCIPPSSLQCEKVPFVGEFAHKCQGCECHALCNMGLSTWDRPSPVEFERINSSCVCPHRMMKMLLPTHTHGGRWLCPQFLGLGLFRGKSGKQLHFWGVHSNNDLFSRHFLGNSKIF